jgi:Na+:H+ antiporter
LVSVELVITSFLVIMLAASFISHKLKLPYTLVLVVVGMILTTASVSSFLAGPFQAQFQAALDGIRSLYSQLLEGPGGGLFVALVIPPLIFEGMMHVSSKDLSQVIRPAFVLATVGVAIATVVGGLALWRLVGLPFYVAFIFAALISPTDAATVVSIFKHAKVPSRLSALLDTEAAFNDATAIVIFSVIVASAGSAGLSLVPSLENFGYVFGGGMVVGFVVAFLAELLGSAIDEKLSRIILTVFAVYGSYTLASAFNVSGLVAVSIVGIYYGSVTARSSVGPSTREGVQTFWEIAAFVGNSIAFLFIGFRTDVTKLASEAGLVLVAYGAVVLSRLVSVYPILSVFDRVGHRIPSSWRNVAMLGGMRGAISVALVASIPATAIVTTADVDTISTMVLGVAFLSISVQAWALSSYIRRVFPHEQAEELNARMSKTLAAIEYLEKLRSEGKINNDSFESELEKEKDELRELLGEIHHSLGTKDLLRTRASALYGSVLALPMSKGMAVLRRNRMDRPIESLVKKTSGAKESEEQKEGAEDRTDSKP